jgi:hypothetical protein
MANEATLIYELEPPIPFTVADNTGIEKGAILKLTDPMTASLADGDGDIIAGIAAEEKIADDGKTKLGVYRRGIFKVLAGTAITVGQAVDTHAATGATNEVAAIGAAGDNMMGIALETAADTDTFLMELKIVHRDMA